MWSCGCILGEMVLGKPLFPGSSTLNQIEKIMASIPPPTHEGLFIINPVHLIHHNLIEKNNTKTSSIYNIPNK